ncbi:MAG: hypothetical protein AAB388_03125 [Patescibacteria group bacterium]
MSEGNWTCSNCGGAITTLPFEPKKTDNLLCRDCHAKKRGGNEASATGGEKKMFEGDWECSECKNKITKLPFQPRDTGTLRCIDCYKKTR